MSRRRVAAVALALVVSGCGVPTGGEPRTIDAAEVPYGLAEPTPTPSAAPSPEATRDPSRVFLVGAGDQLVARTRELGGADREARLEALLSALADGPTTGERDEQLSTALPPSVRLTVGGLSGGTAVVDIAGPADAPSGVASRRAVAQIVLTATSMPGVDRVRLTLDGEPVEAPLPSGQLTSAPLTAADYGAFLTAATAPPS
jgi:hypothetical protein